MKLENKILIFIKIIIFIISVISIKSLFIGKYSIRRYQENTLKINKLEKEIKINTHIKSKLLYKINSIKSKNNKEIENYFLIKKQKYIDKNYKKLILY